MYAACHIRCAALAWRVPETEATQIRSAEHVNAILELPGFSLGLYCLQLLKDHQGPYQSEIVNTRIAWHAKHCSRLIVGDLNTIDDSGCKDQARADLCMPSV